MVHVIINSQICYISKQSLKKLQQEYTLVMYYWVSSVNLFDSQNNQFDNAQMRTIYHDHFQTQH